MLKEELRALVSGDSNLDQQHNSPNKIARAAIFLLHRALRDKVYAVYSLAAEAIRLFFTEFVPARYSQDFGLLHCSEHTLPGCDKINLKN